MLLQSIVRSTWPVIGRGRVLCQYTGEKIYYSRLCQMVLVAMLCPYSHAI